MLGLGLAQATRWILLRGILKAPACACVNNGRCGLRQCRNIITASRRVSRRRVHCRPSCRTTLAAEAPGSPRRRCWPEMRRRPACWCLRRKLRMRVRLSFSVSQWQGQNAVGSGPWGKHCPDSLNLSEGKDTSMINRWSTPHAARSNALRSQQAAAGQPVFTAAAHMCMVRCRRCL